MKTNKFHESVMTREVIDYLNVKNAKETHIKKQARFIDATLGTAGHSVEIIKNGGFVVGIEMDPTMLEIARNRLIAACPGFEGKECFKLIRGNFKDLKEIAQKEELEKVSGIVFDLGVTNLHLTGKTRGFSFREEDAKLDLRLNPKTQGVTGEQIINLLREDQLTTLFSQVMNFRSSKEVAARIVKARIEKRIETVGDFLSALEGTRGKERLHFATLPFLALRMAVNSEIENLKEALPSAFDLLESGGRLVVISFHSKEDLVVEDFFKSKRFEAKILTENYLKPSLQEVQANPRARSARFRVLEKI